MTAPLDSRTSESFSLLRRFLDVSRAISPRRREIFWTVRAVVDSGARGISGVSLRFVYRGLRDCNRWSVPGDRARAYAFVVGPGRPL